MKISQNSPNYNYIQQTYANQTNTPAAKGLNAQKNAVEENTVHKSDSLNLSGLTKDLQKVSKAMETEPADRQQYVADIKQKVETDQYNINAEAVAGKWAAFIINEVG